MNLIRQILAAPRRLYLAISATCLGMLAFGVLYLQGMVGLQPCPMCIVQREALIAVAVFSALAAACKPGGWQRGFGVLALLFAVDEAGGAFSLPCGAAPAPAAALCRRQTT